MPTLGRSEGDFGVGAYDIEDGATAFEIGNAK